MQSAMSEIKAAQQDLQNCAIFGTSHKMSNNFQGLPHYIVNLWEFSVRWIFRYWHCTKFATGGRITICALKQNSNKVWSKMKYILAWYPLSKICFICVNRVYQNYEKLRFNWYKCFIQMKRIFVKILNDNIPHLQLHLSAFLFIGEIVIRRSVANY